MTIAFESWSQGVRVIVGVINRWLNKSYLPRKSERGQN